MTSIPEFDAAHGLITDIGTGGSSAELDDDQLRTWRAFLAASRLMFERIERQLSDEAHMPHAYYDILVFLAEAPDRTMRMGELAAMATSSRSRLSHAVARLEEHGWVVRRSSPGDRRAAFAEITDDGLAVLASATPGYLRTVRSVLFDAVTEGQAAALRDVVEALVAYLEPVRVDRRLPAPSPAHKGSCDRRQDRHDAAPIESE